MDDEGVGAANKINITQKSASIFPDNDGTALVWKN